MFETLKTIHSFLRCRIIQTACNKTLAVESKNFCCQIELGMPVISSCLPAQQITHTGRFLPKGEKRIDRLPTLVNNPHTETKESYPK